MDKFIFILHVFLSVCIIMIVLIQKGKGAEAGTSMGNISDNLFGTNNSNVFLVRLTFFLLFLFIMSSLILNKEISLNKKTVDFNIDLYTKKIDYENLNK
ncbi:MAG TPA: preprotein translocase subunit SecG [Candidatus Azosocius sp. HAIN]